ncbi:unnamed protein product [Arabidopsis halleri]
MAMQEKDGEWFRVESSRSTDSSVMRSKSLEVKTSLLFALRHDV